MVKIITYGKISYNTTNGDRFKKCKQAEKVEVNLKSLVKDGTITSDETHRELLPFEHEGKKDEES